MVVNIEDQKRQAFEMFVKALAAAPDSLIKSLTGKEFAMHAIAGAKEIEGYIFPQKPEK